MGKLIAVAGNLGAGKTTLTKLLCEQASFVPYWEHPEARPFQRQFSDNLTKWSLANQVDFLVFRGEQELSIRRSDIVGVQDGSLDQDFYVFTRHLFNQGFLDQEQYQLCQRVRDLIREYLPPPEVIVRVVAPIPVLVQRRVRRSRQTDAKIIRMEELTDLELLLNDWIANINQTPVINIDSSNDYTSFVASVCKVIPKVKALIEAPRS